MTPARRRFLDEHITEGLTEDEIKEGYFFCCDWDGLLLHKTDHEAIDCCSCSRRSCEEQLEIQT